MLPKIVQNCSTWPELARQKCSKLLEMSQNVSKCLTMGQQVSKGVMCVHIQVRKLSFLGIAVAGVYCCMGLRSVSIEPRSCLLLRSEPSIVSFNWQGSLVIRLVAIVSTNSLSRKHRIALIEKKRSCPQFLLLHYCLLVIPQSDMNFWDFLGFFEILKVADLNLTDLHPKLRTVNGLKTMKHGDIGISINGNGDQRGYESKCDGATLSNSSIGMEVRQTCLIPPYSTVHVGSSDVKKKTDTSDTYFFAFEIIPYKCC